MKRFIDTCRFADPWYFDLPPEMKCAWEYIWSSCDNAGVWQVNTKLADLQIGRKVDWPEFLKRCEGRIVELPRVRWFVESFVRFQCGTLSENSRPHAVVIGLLRTHGLMKPDSLQIDYPIVYVETMHSHKDKEQDKDQYKDKEQDTRAPAKASKDRGTIKEIKAFAIEIGQPQSDGEACFHKWEGNGWINGSAKIKDWRATMRAWKTSGYLPSQKNGGTPHLPLPKAAPISDPPRWAEYQKELGYWTPTTFAGATEGARLNFQDWLKEKQTENQK